MTTPKDKHSDFISSLKEIVYTNISNEQFGVSELADAVGMSRSNLLRKVKKATHLSVSQFIRNIRLEQAYELLQESELSVSEVSYAVGFGSTSYFTKCFKDMYGYPPGDTLDQLETQEVVKRRRTLSKKVGYGALLTIIIIGLIYMGTTFTEGKTTEPTQVYGKSIAVLPFVNNSVDESNTYFVNGLMVSVLNDLQKIENLKVISRTSVEKYRTNPKTIPEIGEELNVSYLVEGSGQRIDDQILLNVQLLDASKDEPIWSQQF
jgi:TolB-like protein/AraC-like DNA-binding protein